MEFELFNNIHFELRVIVDIIIASVLTGLVGLERELSGKPAGFRTQMIIGGAAALLISTARILIRDFAGESELAAVMRADPVRVIEAVIVGISFIGAGTILKMEDQRKVQYLTTAASILLSAGIGMSVALHHYIIAVGVTIFILIVNVGANVVDHHIKKRREK
ncbi:MAG: MgtC/SapB family protein [Bacteroidales bacterium]|nr:MgtC/SapB family protein [Bacteroidales bacterium]